MSIKTSTPQGMRVKLSSEFEQPHASYYSWTHCDEIFDID